MKKLQLKIINPVPNIDLLTTALITQGMQDKRWRKHFSFYFEENYSTFKNDFLNWYDDISFWRKFGQTAFNKVYHDKKFASLIYKKHKNIGKLSYRLCDQILEKEIRELSNGELYGYLDKLFYYFKEICFWGFIPPVIDFENNYLSGFLEDKVYESVKKHKIKKPAQEILSILTTPNELTFTQKENIDLLELAAKKKINKEDLLKHYNLYKWIDYGYMGLGKAQRLSYFNKKLNEFKKSGKSPGQLLSGIYRERERSRSDQKKYAQKLHLDGKTRHLFQAAGIFMFIKVYRAEVENKIIFVYDKLFKEIKKRFGYSAKQLHYCIPEEILGIFRGKKPDKKELNRRINSFFTCTFIRGKTRFYYGKKARSIFKGKLYQEKIDKSVREFRGMSAYLGRAKGRVKIVNVPGEMKKMKNGDILVSIATNPNIVPAMKKAGAFVTDTGGITCHAAIVARELKKPCVIGTKIATKVLKDGDKVEVDADNGIIKII